jgi:ABC-type sulfate transport system permease component
MKKTISILTLALTLFTVAPINSVVAKSSQIKSVAELLETINRPGVMDADHYDGRITLTRGTRVTVLSMWITRVNGRPVTYYEVITPSNSSVRVPAFKVILM